jgi:hypothetical protein
LDRGQDNVHFVIHSFKEKTGLEGDEIVRMKKEKSGQSLKLRNKVFTLKFRKSIALLIMINKRKRIVEDLSFCGGSDLREHFLCFT